MDPVSYNKNSVSGFNATDIYPFCPSAIPEHAFALSDQIPLLSGNSNQDKEIPTSTASSSVQETPATPTSIAVDLSPPRESIAASSGTQEGSKETFTPTKILNQISPIPNLPEKGGKGRSSLHRTLLRKTTFRAKWKN